MADALGALRAATRDRHTALDASDWFARATVDITAYAQHLALVERFYRHAERDLDVFTAALTERGFDPIARRKGAALGTERSELPPVTDGDASASTFPALRNASAAIGCFYVLEGATLGGTVLGDRIHERLGWRSRFYGIYGAQTGAMWRAFTVALQRLDDVDIASLVDAAERTFDAYAADVTTPTVR